jgi:aspartyl-tRNA(Asn)/glutamyl-tRNA(Gln) amidotransferase subunit C
MKITKEIVQKTAHLARLHFEDDEATSMINDLQKVVDWIEKLSEVDTEGVAPLTGMSFETNVFREDEVGEHLPRESALKNAPLHDDTFFQVPKVIDQK